MGVKLRLGARLAFAGLLVLALLVGFVGRGSAHITDVSNVSVGNGATIVEGQTASFPVSLDQPASDGITIAWSASNGTSGSVDVSTGGSGATIQVPTVDDGVPMPDSTLSVTLGQITITDPNDTTDPTTVASDASAGSGTATVTDNDWRIGAIAMSPGSGSVSEKGSNTIDFQVTLEDPQGDPVNAVAGHPVTVDYAIANGSAKLGTNYSITQPSNGHATGTLTFAAGTSTVDVQVTSIDDGIYGGNKTLSVTYQNPQGATFLGNEQATGTITEADAPPLMGISNCSTTGSVNGGDVATFAVRLAGNAKTSVTSAVNFATADDSTIPGDYTPVTGTASIPAGQHEYDIQVQTANNPPSGTRSFHIQLSSPQNVQLLETTASCSIVSTAGGGGGGGGGGGTGSGGSVTITDPNPVTSPSSGSVPVSVPLSLALPNPLPSSPGPVTVSWQTQDGTAKAPADYTAASGTVTWPAGAGGANPTPVTINVNADPSLTQPVTFTVDFTSTSATFVGGGTATITIVPAGSTTPVLSIGDASAPSKSGTVPVVVTMTPAASGSVSVNYATADGTDADAAKAGVNYTAKSGTLTFAPGVTTQTINIAILPNTSTQPNRDFTVGLSGATGGSVIAVGSATVTILNDFGATVTPPILKPNPTPITKPKPLQQTQPTSTASATTTHLVLVQLYTGTAKVTAAGKTTFVAGCPSITVKACTGKATFDVRVQQKKGKQTTTKTVRVANGSYSIKVGKKASFVVKLTPAGLKLLKTYKRLQVKATLTSKDGSGAVGVTAWLVALQAQKPTAKAKSKSSKSKSKSKSKSTKTKTKTKTKK
jgi:Calx-beta domain